MKCLSLLDYQSDFLSHVVLTGLWEIPNVEVYEMPILNSVRGGVDKNYRLPDGTLGFTGTNSYLQPNPLPPQLHTREEILDTINDFDFVIMLSGREHARRALDDILVAKNLSARTLPLILCDGEDSHWLPIDLVRNYFPQILFKRELLRENSLDEYRKYCGIPVYPLPFASFTRSLPDVDDSQKLYDIFLSLGRTYPARDVLIGKFLDTAIEQNLTHWIGTNSNSPLFQAHPHGHLLHDLLPWQEYMSRQAQSQITASIRGFGRDALHAFEAFSFATCVLYCDPEIYIPHPFVDRQHCIYFDENCEDIPRKIQWLVNDDPYRRYIAAGGKRHCREFHSTKARSEYLISIASKMCAGEKIYPEEYGL